MSTKPTAEDSEKELDKDLESAVENDAPATERRARKKSTSAPSQPIPVGDGAARAIVARLAGRAAAVDA